MEFWKMNGAGNDFIIYNKIKTFSKNSKSLLTNDLFYDKIKYLTVKFIKTPLKALFYLVFSAV